MAESAHYCFPSDFWKASTKAKSLLSIVSRPPCPAAWPARARCSEQWASEAHCNTFKASLLNRTLLNWTSSPEPRACFSSSSTARRLKLDFGIKNSGALSERKRATSRSTFFVYRAPFRGPRQPTPSGRTAFTLAFLDLSGSPATAIFATSASIRAPSYTTERPPVWKKKLFAPANVFFRRKSLTDCGGRGPRHKEKAASADPRNQPPERTQDTKTQPPERTQGTSRRSGPKTQPPERTQGTSRRSGPKARKTAAGADPRNQPPERTQGTEDSRRSGPKTQAKHQEAAAGADPRHRETATKRQLQDRTQRVGSKTTFSQSKSFFLGGHQSSAMAISEEGGSTERSTGEANSPDRDSETCLAKLGTPPPLMHKT